MAAELVGVGVIVSPECCNFSVRLGCLGLRCCHFSLNGANLVGQQVFLLFNALNATFKRRELFRDSVGSHIGGNVLNLSVRAGHSAATSK